jgi:colanic acid/amylovoran biosynthesis glycosyltransferase
VYRGDASGMIYDLRTVLMVSIAYVISQYPTFNHTFVLREVRALRACGAKVQTISVRGPDRRREQLTTEEQEEMDTTLYVLAAGPLRILAAHMSTFARRPSNYCAGLGMAIRLAGLDLSRFAAHMIAFAEAVAIGNWAARRGFRHLHTHFCTDATMLAARIFSLSFSMTIHGPDEFNDVVAFHLAEKVAKGRFACAISHFGKSQIMRASAWQDWSKIEYSYLGVDPAIFTPRPFRRSPDPFRILSVGRLAPAKGHHVLIAAITILVEEGRRVELLIAGDGPERRALEQHAADCGLGERVHFTGALPQPEIRALYQETDCFALASFAEGIPVVLMEAMAMEIPCVTTWINGIPELIRHEIDGLLAPPSDVSTLARQIARLMDDAALCERLGRAGRCRVMEAFTLDKNAGHLAGIFERRLGAEFSTKMNQAR